jgi:hypothetical protein
MRSSDFQLTTLSGPLDGLAVVVQHWPVTIGRSSENTVPLRLDVWASREHARLDYEDEQVWLEDLGDLNITAVGRQLVRGRVPLALETTFRVGRTLLRLERLVSMPESSDVTPTPGPRPPTANNPLDSTQFSAATRQIVAEAVAESARLRHYYLGVEHLFITASRTDRPLGSALAHHGLPPGMVQERLRVEAGPGSVRRPWQGIILTPRADRLLSALASHARPVGETALVKAILADPDALPTRWLREQGCDPTVLIRTLDDARRTANKTVSFSDFDPSSDRVGP